MDNKKMPLVIGLAVVAVVVLLWSMRGSLGVGGGSDKAPSGPPKQGAQEYSKYTQQGGKR